MPRYILVDHHSGYVFGDTGDLNGPARQETVTQAARRLDESIGEHGRVYDAHAPNYRPNGTAYHVYRAEIGGSQALPLVTDGQDHETIDQVARLCTKVAVVTCARPADDTT